MCGFQAGFRSFSKCKTYNTNTIIYTSMSTALHRDHKQLRGMNFSPKAAGFLFVMWSGRLGIRCCWSNPHIDTFRMNESSDWSSSICLYFKYLKSSASTRPIKHTHYNRLWNCEARDFSPGKAGFMNDIFHTWSNQHFSFQRRNSPQKFLLLDFTHDL